MKAEGFYTVRYDRDPSGWWIVWIPEVQGCRTQGRSISQGRRRIREALSLFIDEELARTVELRDDVRLPGKVRRTLQQVARARELAERARRGAQAEMKSAVAELVDGAGLSVRDAAEMLGVSYQRVQQMTDPG